MFRWVVKFQKGLIGDKIQYREKKFKNTGFYMYQDITLIVDLDSWKDLARATNWGLHLGGRKYF